MADAVKIAIGATVYALAVIFLILWFVNKLKEPENFCVYCGDPCNGEFCSEAHSLLFYDEDDLAREEIIDCEDEEALREIEELEREERRSKAY